MVDILKMNSGIDVRDDHIFVEKGVSVELRGGHTYRITRDLNLPYEDHQGLGAVIMIQNPVTKRMDSFSPNLEDGDVVRAAEQHLVDMVGDYDRLMQLDDEALEKEANAKRTRQGLSELMVPSYSAIRES